MQGRQRPRSAGVGAIQRILAVIGLVLTSPLTAVACVVIRVASPGPALFRAQRVGQNGVEFTMLKLRTMHVAASGSSITAGRDPRVFRAGRALRALKIDELPQLVNIVRGEMAFVGPRPEAPDVVSRHYQPWMHETLEVPPGIVGPGSLGYYYEEDLLPDDSVEAAEIYATTLLPRKLARDLVFVRRRTLGYQLELVLRTLMRIAHLDGWLQGFREREDAAAMEILGQVEPGGAQQ